MEPRRSSDGAQGGIQTLLLFAARENELQLLHLRDAQPAAMRADQCPFSGTGSGKSPTWILFSS